MTNLKTFYYQVENKRSSIYTHLSYTLFCRIRTEKDSKTNLKEKKLTAFPLMIVKEEEETIKGFVDNFFLPEYSFYKKDLFFKMNYIKIEVRNYIGDRFSLRSLLCFNNIWYEWSYNENMSIEEVHTYLRKRGEEMPPTILNIFLEKKISLDSTLYTCEDIFKTTDQSLVREKGLDNEYHYSEGYSILLKKVTDFSLLEGRKI